MKKLAENKFVDLKIAYIGGGSRGWARSLMSDLAKEEEICGTVYLYDINYEAAKANEIIGNGIGELDGVKSVWKYKAVETLKEALTDSDFVIISILPGTFDDMRSDVHTPEKYGIYQSVGDTTGPGGIFRVLRTIPMYKVIAEGVRDYCPDAWVINYTNPMTMCCTALYKYFPRIKAFGCCHEVFGTQTLLGKAYAEKYGKELERKDVNINVLGINHFTWITEAHYEDVNLFPIYDDFVNKYYDSGYGEIKENWANKSFICLHKVKFDLYKRYGAIACAGDRHLSEFCPGSWYLKNPEQVKQWKFGLTTVDWRINDMKEKIAKTNRLLEGKEKFVLEDTGEEGTKQMKAILGINPFITNVNLPNKGQVSDLPLGAVVETNAFFSARGVQPVVAGELPQGVDNLVKRVVYNQLLTVEAAMTGNYELAFKAFVNDPLVTIPVYEARKLFNEMLENTKKYLY